MGRSAVDVKGDTSGIIAPRSIIELTDSLLKLTVMTTKRKSTTEWEGQ
jgi:hypothetical protein